MSLPVLTTDCLLIRPYRVEDAEDALRIYGDPEVTRWIGGRTIETLDAMREDLRDTLEREAARPPGLGTSAVAEREGGRVVGTMLLKHLPPTEDVEIGWHFARDRWGRGYATEAARAVLHHALTTVGLKEVHAVTDPGNDRSACIALKLGMTHQGLTARYYGIELEHYLLRVP